MHARWPSGNGIQHQFYDDPNVLYISLHRYDNGRFYPHNRDADLDAVGGPNALGRYVVSRGCHAVTRHQVALERDSGHPPSRGTGSPWDGPLSDPLRILPPRNVNIPWPTYGMTDVDYLHAFQRVIMPIAYEFDPELVYGTQGGVRPGLCPSAECLGVWPPHRPTPPTPLCDGVAHAAGCVPIAQPVPARARRFSGVGF